MFEKCCKAVGDEESPQNSFEVILTFVHVLVSVLLLMDTVKPLFGGIKVLSLEKFTTKNRQQK